MKEQIIWRNHRQRYGNLKATDDISLGSGFKNCKPQLRVGVRACVKRKIGEYVQISDFKANSNKIYFRFSHSRIDRRTHKLSMNGQTHFTITPQEKEWLEKWVNRGYQLKKIEDGTYYIELEDE